MKKIYLLLLLSLLNSAGFAQTDVSRKLTKYYDTIGHVYRYSPGLPPAHGTLTGFATYTATAVPFIPSGITYTPASGYHGDDSIEVIIADLSGISVAETLKVHLIVQAPLPPPPFQVSYRIFSGQKFWYLNTLKVNGIHFGSPSSPGFFSFKPIGKDGIVPANSTPTGTSLPSGQASVAFFDGQTVDPTSCNGNSCAATCSTAPPLGGVVVSNPNLAISNPKPRDPHDVTVDVFGEILTADNGHHRINMLNTVGDSSSIAGDGTAGYSGDGGPATVARINDPYAITTDYSGNLYIADFLDHRVRKVTYATGVITTIAGNGSDGNSGDGGAATAAQIGYPSGIAVDSAGNVYIADSAHNVIRKVNTAGIISTYAGTGTAGSTGDGGAAASARLNQPHGLSVTPTYLFIADAGNNKIRKVNLSTNIITSIAGTGTAGESGDIGPAIAATLNYPVGVAADTNGFVYIADYGNNRARFIEPNDTIYTYAGTGVAGSSGAGQAAITIQLNGPTGVAVDPNGRGYIADNGNVWIVGNPVVFTSGYSQSLIICADASATSLDSLLAVSDLHSSLTETWSVFSDASHGTVGGFGTSPTKASNGGIVLPSGLTYTPTPGYVGVDTFYIKVSNDSDVDITKIAVLVLPLPLPINGTKTVCGIGKTTALSDSTNFGIWCSSNGTIATIGSTGIVTGLAFGTDTIIYTATFGCKITAVVSVNAIPGAITGANTVCHGSTITLSDTTSGGAWSSSTASLATVGTGGVVTGVSIFTGVDTIYYTHAGCKVADTIVVGTLAPAPILGLDATYTGLVITLTDATNSGVWSSGDPTIATVDASGNVTGVSPGGLRIFYSYTNTCGSTTAGKDITVYDIPFGGLSPDIHTFAGTGTAGYSGDGGPVVASQLNYPVGVAIDDSGNVYITEVNNDVVRKVSRSGVISTLAGSTFNFGYSGDGGSATSAQLNNPWGLAVDGRGNIYVADVQNNVIRKVDTSGKISTFAGNGTPGFSGDGSAATAAQLYLPYAIAVDGPGNVYIADAANFVIRKVNTSGNISTFAGTYGVFGYSGDGGPAIAAQFSNPMGVAVDGSGNVYVVDQGNFIVRKIDASSGNISTFAGTQGFHGYTGDGGPAIAAQIGEPTGIAIDGTGNVYISGGNVVRKVDASGMISTYAGNGTGGYSGDGNPANSYPVTLGSPWGIATDATGSLYIADFNDNVVRLVGTHPGYPPLFKNGNSQTFAVCKNAAARSVDSLMAIVDFNHGLTDTLMVSLGPANGGLAGFIATAASGSGNTVIPMGLTYTPATDYSGMDTFAIRASNINGASTTTINVTVDTMQTSIPPITFSFSSTYPGIASNLFDALAVGVWSSSDVTIAQVTSFGVGYGANVVGLAPGTATITYAVTNSCGTATTSQTMTFAYPTDGISPDIFTFAGNGIAGDIGDGGPATAAEFDLPYNVAVDTAGNVYICDAGFGVIRKVDLAGNISTVAGSAIIPRGYSGDGGMATDAQLNFPVAVTVDGPGNIYIADQGNQIVRKIDPSGIISTYAGTQGTAGYAGDGGAAVGALFNQIWGLAVDQAGNLYIADQLNFVVRKVDPSGIISTYAGMPGSSGYGGDGGPANTAQISQPYDLAVDAAGSLYIADKGNGDIRKVDPTGNITTFAGDASAGRAGGDGGPATAAGLPNITGIAVDSGGNVYIAEFGNSVVRKVDTSGIISSYAGYGGFGYSGDGGPADVARLFFPFGIAVTGSGKLYIADIGNDDIRIVGAPARTVAFTGGAAQTFVVCENASSVPVNALLAVSDSTAGQINVFTVSSGPSHGSLGGFPATDTAVTAAGVTIPYGLTYIPAPGYSGNDTFTIKVSSDGVSTTTTIFVNIDTTITSIPPITSYISTPSPYAGLAFFLSEASTGGVWSSSDSTVLTFIFLDDDGFFNVPYLIGANPGTAMITYAVTNGCGSISTSQSFTFVYPTGGTSPDIFTFAGNGYGAGSGGNIGGFSGDGGPATAAELKGPYNVAVDGAGNVYIADFYNAIVRKVNTSGTISLIAGRPGFGADFGDGGPATDAALFGPDGVAVDGAGNVYIGDPFDFVIRKVDPSGIISVYAGNGTSGYTGDGGAAISAQISSTSQLATDAIGNLYITDYSNHAIRKVDPSGTITTIAGNGTLGFSGDGGPATAAELNFPLGVAVDGSGNVFIADDGNNRIRKVDTSGNISTFAGTGFFAGTLYGASGDGGPATAATLYGATGVGVDNLGNVFFVDEGDNVIRKVDGSGIISTYAGYGGVGYSGDGGPANDARLGSFLGTGAGIAVTGSGKLYIADFFNNVVRIVGAPALAFTGGATKAMAICENTTDNSINPLLSTSDTTIGLTDTFSVGSGPSHGALGGFPATYTSTGGVTTPIGLTYTPATGYSGTDTFTIMVSNGHATAITTTYVTVSPLPAAGTITGSTTVYAGSSTMLSDLAAGGTWSSSNTPVATTDLSGTITALAPGTTTITYADSNGCGPTVYATVNITVSIAPTSPTITTFAGNQLFGDNGDGNPATTASLGGPTGLATDTSGNVYIVDFYNSVVRKVSPSGIISTIAGTGGRGYSGDGGAATAAELDLPNSVAVDNAGNIFISDETNNVVRKIDTAGIITTVAGNGFGAGSSGATGGYSGDGGQATIAELHLPVGIAVDASGNLYIADEDNNVVRKVNTSGVISTYAGNGTPGFSGDGGNATAAQLSSPQFVAVDGAGNVYISDVLNHRVRKVNTAGIITTFAGTGVAGYSGDGGLAVYAQITYPGGIAADTFGNVFINDNNHSIVRKVDASGIVSTYAGNSIFGYSGDGGPANMAQVGNPYSLTTDRSGRLFIGDLDNFDVRLIGPPLPVISGEHDVCVGAATTLSDDTTGGAWSSGDTSIAAVGSLTGVVTGLSAGTAIITYKAIGLIATKIVTVNTFPVAGTISGVTTVCSGATDSLGDDSTGGAWSSNATDIAIIGSTGIVTGVSSGMANISYSITNSCGTAAVTIDIMVNSMPDAGTINGTATVCVGSTIALTDDTTGGVWSSDNTEVATVNVDGVVFGVTAGGANISYMVTNSCGATARATAMVTVNSLPDAGTISGTTTVCVGATDTLSDGVAGGVWSSRTTDVATVTTSGIVTGAGAGTVTISYTTSNGCGSVSATIVETVNPLAIAGIISGPTAVCIGSLDTLSAGMAGGVWSSMATDVATVSTSGVVTGVASSITTISYTVVNSCGTSAATLMLTVNSAPEEITGTAKVCEGLTTLLSETTTGGTWSSSVSTIATIGSTGTVTGVLAGTSAIAYTLPTGCSVNKIITVNQTPTAITGRAVICLGSAIALDNTITGGVWSSSGTDVTIVGSTGVATGAALGTATITYALSTGCTATKSLTVYPFPAPIRGATHVCSGLTTTLSSTAGGTWSSSNSFVAPVSSSGIVTGETVPGATIATITYTLESGCNVNTIVTVYPVPSTISGASLICAGGATTSLSDATGSGTWSSGTASVATVSSGGTVTGILAGLSTITYTLPVGCIATKVVTVDPLPAAYTLTGSSDCAGGSGGSFGLSGSDTGVSYTLYLDGSGGTSEVTISGTGAAITFGTFTAPGTYTAVATNTTTGCYSAMSGSMVSSPFVTISGTFGLCATSSSTLTGSPSGGTWSSSTPAHVIVASSTGIITGVATGASVITYTTPGGCIATQAVTDNPNPSAIRGTARVCAGAMVTVSSSAGGTWSSVNTSVATVGSSGIITGVSGGTATISYLLGTGCGISTIATVNPLPAITGSGSVSVGATILLDGLPTAGAWTSSTAGIATVGAGSGVVGGVSAGAATITYTLGITGCRNTKPVTVSSPGMREAPPVNGVITPLASGNIIVAPNPNKGIFTIKGTLATTDDIEVSIEVTNLIGQVIYKDKVMAGNGELHDNIQLSNSLANGMYLLYIYTGTEKKVFNIVVEQW